MRIKSFIAAFVAFAALSATAQAATNLVKNGDFESATNAGHQIGYGSNRSQIADWTSAIVGKPKDPGYSFLFTAAGNQNLTLYAPAGVSPTGGNYFAGDGNWYAAALSQTVTGLVVGDSYTLSFNYAVAQQNISDKTNLDNQFIVSLGNQTQTTTSYNNTAKGFSGWMASTMTFTASSSTEVLSFLASSAPQSGPPFMLLDSVSLVSAVPEPATMGMMLGGLGLIGMVARRRRNAAKA